MQSKKYKSKSIESSFAFRLVVAIVLLSLFSVGYYFLSKHLMKGVFDTEPKMPENLEKAVVTWVNDGDTITCRIGDETEETMVRLIGFDAPESVHPDEAKNTEEGRKAASYVKSRLLGMTVYLEYDEQLYDKYGRKLAYVWLDGELFNKEVIAEGYAELMDIPPNEKYSDVFREVYPEK